MLSKYGEYTEQEHWNDRVSYSKWTGENNTSTTDKIYGHTLAVLCKPTEQHQGRLQPTR